MTVHVPARLKAAMSAVSSLFGSGAGRFGLGWIRESFPGAWQRNVVQADPLTTLTSFGAVYACVSRISNDIAKLEPRLMRQVGSVWAPAPKDSPHWIPLRKPNGFQNRIQFFAYWLTCKLLHGNAYTLKARDGRGMVSRLYLLDPRRVVPLVTVEGDVYYQIHGDDLSRIHAGVTVPASEVIHDRMNCLWHPLVGISPLCAAGFSATQGLRIQANSQQFFANMSRPSGMLTAPGTIDPVTASRLKAEWEQNFSGANIGRLAVLGDALKYEAMTIPPEAAQLIDQLQWTVADVARAFDMPAYKIGSGPMPTSNNVESLNLEYYSSCLQKHIEDIELCLNEGLALPDGDGVEFNVGALLRMDQESQMRMLSESVKGAIRTPNEARSEVNLGPLEGGNTVYLQVQNYSLSALAKRDARPDPFASSGSAPAPAPAPALSPAPQPPDAAAGKALTAEWQEALTDGARDHLPPLKFTREGAHA